MQLQYDLSWDLIKTIALFIPLIIILIYYIGYLMISYEEIFLIYYRKIDKYDILKKGVEYFMIPIFFSLVFIGIILYIREIKSFWSGIVIPFLYYLTFLRISWFVNKKLNQKIDQIIDESDKNVYINYLVWLLLLYLIVPILFPDKNKYLMLIWIMVFIFSVALISRCFALSSYCILYVELYIDKSKELSDIPYSKDGKICGILAKETDKDYILYFKKENGKGINYVLNKEYVISCEIKGKTIEEKRIWEAVKDFIYKKKK